MMFLPFGIKPVDEYDVEFRIVGRAELFDVFHLAAVNKCSLYTSHTDQHEK